jgi:hypothetical protein
MGAEIQRKIENRGGRMFENQGRKNENNRREEKKQG